MGNQSPQEDDLDLDDFLAPFMGDEDSESQALSQHLDEVLDIASEAVSTRQADLKENSNEDADGLIPEPYIESEEEEEVFEVGFQNASEADPSLTAINTDDGGYFEKDDPEDLGAEVEVEVEALGHTSDEHDDDGPAVEFDLDFNDTVEQDNAIAETEDPAFELSASDNDAESDESSENDDAQADEFELDIAEEPAFELEADETEINIEDDAEPEIEFESEAEPVTEMEIESDFEIEMTHEVEVPIETPSDEAVIPAAESIVSDAPDAVSEPEIEDGNVNPEPAMPVAAIPEPPEADNPVGMAPEVSAPEQETSSPALQKPGEMDYKVSGESIPETTPVPAESFAGSEPVETVGSQQATLSQVQQPEPPISIQQVEESSVSETETAAAQSSTGVALGKGIDIGTANLLAAVQDDSGKIIVKKQRNAFVDIPADSHQKAMLTRLKVPYVVQGKQMYVLGDAAFELANVLNKNTRRPMQAGLLSPKEAAAVPVMKLLIENILGQPRQKGEPVFFSVPGEPIDSDLNVVYHKDIFKALLNEMGYAAQDINEGHAVVISELAEEDFTGIGISCGGGMANACVSYRSLPALTFAVSRGGDWIDSNAANVLGIKSAKATMIKESGMDVNNPRNREEEAVSIYMRAMVTHVLVQIAERFNASDDMPAFPDPIIVTFAGGTPMIKGFKEIVMDEFDKIEFPIPVKEVRVADDPLNAVARGCLLMALSE